MGSLVLRVGARRRWWRRSSSASPAGRSSGRGSARPTRPRCARVEAELRQRFDASADTLGALAARVAAERDAIRAAPRDPAAARRLFDAVDAALSGGRAGRHRASPSTTRPARRWRGRAACRSCRPNASTARRRSSSRRARSARGWCASSPSSIADRPTAPRLATIVVEQVLGRERGAPARRHLHALHLARAGARCASACGDRSAALSGRLHLRHPVARRRPRWSRPRCSPADLAAARAALGARHVGGGAVGRRRHAAALRRAAPRPAAAAAARRARSWRRRRGLLAALAARAGDSAGSPLAPLTGPRSPTAPTDLLLDGLALTVAGLAAARQHRAARALDRAARAAAGRRRPRSWSPGRSSRRRARSTPGCSSATSAFLAGVVAGTSLDLLHFSLHPFNASRLAIAFGLVLLHASVVWGAVIVVRLRRHPAAHAARGRAASDEGDGVGARRRGGGRRGLAPRRGAAARRDRSPRSAPSACAPWRPRASTGGAGARRRPRGSAPLFLALVVPAIALYPSLLAYATAAKERLVATELRAAGGRASARTCSTRLRAGGRADRRDARRCAEFVAGSADARRRPPTAAFAVWSQTDLATYRLTSAVELYARGRRARQPLRANLPEYTTAPYRATGCQLGRCSTRSRRSDRASGTCCAPSRGICDRGRDRSARSSSA